MLALIWAAFFSVGHRRHNFFAPFVNQFSVSIAFSTSRNSILQEDELQLPGAKMANVALSVVSLKVRATKQVETVREPLKSDAVPGSRPFEVSR